MPSDVPKLPDAHTVSEAAQAWALTDLRLAALLASGLSRAQALGRWGIQLLKADRISDAISALRAAVALEPDDAILWTNLGAAFDRANSPGEAAASLERSLALLRRQADTWLLLGLVRKKLNNAAAAEAAFRTALEQEPKSTAAWQCLGLLKEEQRNYAEAIDCFAACIKNGGVSPAISANLGKLLYQTGMIPEAYDAYARATAAEPGNPHYRQMLRKGRFLLDILEAGSVDDALATYRRSLLPTDDQTDKGLSNWFEAASALLSSFGHIDAAIRVAKKRLELWPASASANYLLSAFVGKPDFTRSPREYIVESFDAFADGFDAKLVGVLDYDVPQQLTSLVRDATTPGRLYETLDAGCGTGMCGHWLRPMARTLTGVDLSSRMLEHAEKRGVYDALRCEELTAFLESSPKSFDLIVAADVLIYFGDLADVFRLGGSAIVRGGFFAFSVERFRDGRDKGYRLGPSGRFAHSPEYVRSSAGAAFVERRCVETTLRLEGVERVGGNLFLFERL